MADFEKLSHHAAVAGRKGHLDVNVVWQEHRARERPGGSWKADAEDRMLHSISYLGNKLRLATIGHDVAPNDLTLILRAPYEI